jgi:hypothetical protein
VNDSVGNTNYSTILFNITEADITPADMDFVDPTPANGTSTSNTNVEINVSMTYAGKLNNSIWNWNGTNYTMYNDSLVLMYNFDNVSSLGENDTHVMDLSNHGNNGTASGGFLANVSGKYGGAFRFDGKEDYVDISNTFSFGGSSLTISSWVNPAELTVDQAIFAMRDDGGSDNWQLYGSLNAEDVLYFSFWSGNVEKTCTTDDSLTLNTWQHITSTYDGSNVVIYLDGNEVHNCALTGAIDDEDTTSTIGQAGSSGFFNGSIDELRIWNRTLGSEEVYLQYVSNLRKLDAQNWTLYVNQSLNATDGLIADDYTYYTKECDC